MVDLRDLAVQSLVGTNAPLVPYIGDRVFQSGSRLDAPIKPFIILKFGIATEYTGWRDGPVTTIVEHWVHDLPGDYNTIDTIVGVARTTYHALPSQEQFIESRFLSVTGDLDDPDLGTIMKIARYQWVTSS